MLATMLVLPPQPLLPEHALKWILTVVVTAGVGGLVHGLMRPEPHSYSVAWPFFQRKTTELGFLGDILVGIAAGFAIFFVIDSLFNLKLDDDLMTFLKVVALGVISGYIGVSILNGLSLIIFKRIAQEEINIDKMRADFEQLKKQKEAASIAADHIALADAYWRWGKDQKKPELLERAEEQFDAAIQADPDNPNHYIKKSFVFAEKAALAGGDKNALYDAAIAQTDAAIDRDKSSPSKKATARAYYDRACYKHLKKVDVSEVIRDLQDAIRCNDVMRKMAKLDPDLKDLYEQNAQFKALVDTETAGMASEKVTQH